MNLDLSYFDAWFVAKCVYGSLTFTVYILTIIMQHKHRALFTAMFFILYKMNFSYNLVTFATSLVKIGPANSSCENCTSTSFGIVEWPPTLENASNYLLNIVYCIQTSMTPIQYSGILLVSLDRFTNLLSIRNSDRCFKKLFPFIIVFVIVLSLSMTWPILKHLVYYNHSESYGDFDNVLEEDMNFVRYSTLILEGVITTASVIVTFATIIRIIQLNLLYRLYDKKFICMVFILSTIQLVGFVANLIIELSTSSIAEIATFFLPIVSDLLTLSQPWLLLASSKSIRRKMIEMYTSIRYPEPPFQRSEIVYHSHTTQQRQQPRVNRNPSTSVSKRLPWSY